MIPAVACALIGLCLCCGAGGGALAADKASTPRAWQSDEPKGGWNHGGFYLFNNVWNQKSKPGPQHIWANSYKDWGVTSTQTTSTAVRAYPCVQKNLKGGGVKAGAFTRMISAYAEQGPEKGIYNASYDLWFNGLKKEVMFWVDSAHWGDLGKPLEIVTLGGKRWKVYHEGGYTRFQLEKTEKSGTVDLLAGIQYMIGKGWLSPEDLAWQINFGFEICSTENRPCEFRVRDYSLETTWGK